MNLTAVRAADYPIDRAFLERWSPRSFGPDQITKTELLTLLEAGRWAPSCLNSQPWRFIYGFRGTPSFDQILAGLWPSNQAWARNAAALVVLLSVTRWQMPGQAEARPLPTHAFDTGAAWMSIALQAHSLRWVAHGMAGIDAEALRATFAVPEDHAVQMAFAVGRRGEAELLPEALRQREVASLRRPLSELADEGRLPDQPVPSVKS
jgi:nitroreductase